MNNTNLNVVDVRDRGQIFQDILTEIGKEEYTIGVLYGYRFVTTKQNLQYGCQTFDKVFEPSFFCNKQKWKRFYLERLLKFAKVTQLDEYSHNCYISSENAKHNILLRLSGLNQTFIDAVKYFSTKRVLV